MPLSLIGLSPLTAAVEEFDTCADFRSVPAPANLAEGSNRSAGSTAATQRTLTDSRTDCHQFWWDGVDAAGSNRTSNGLMARAEQKDGNRKHRRHLSMQRAHSQRRHHCHRQSKGSKPCVSILVNVSPFGSHRRPNREQRHRRQQQPAQIGAHPSRSQLNGSLAQRHPWA
jgi:hypothetical protein